MIFDHGLHGRRRINTDENHFFSLRVIRKNPCHPWFFFLFIFLPFVACDKQPSRIKPVQVYEQGEDAEYRDITLENNFLEFRFLPKTAEIILTDKSSGTQWRSTPPDIETDPLADPVTRDMMASQFVLQYGDAAGVAVTLYSSEHSTVRGAYEYALVDGGLEVNYTVGNIARSFRIPPAMQEEKMRDLLEQMEREDRRKVEASYRLYDINNLRANDDKTTLLTQYPDLARRKLYVLRDTTQDYMKEQMEEIFANTGYTYDDYLEDISRYASSSGSDKPAFNITLRYTLDGKSLVLAVPFDKIAYLPAYPIIQLSLLPFMGAGSTTDNGYMLVPDGSGAIIYFNNDKQSQISSNSIVYGWDEAMPRDVVISDNSAPFPAFGIQKNGKALLCLVEEGSAYAQVRADVSGRNCSYNSVHPRFDMVHGATMDISGRSDRAVFLYESGLPAGENITLRYTPCASDGYVGMAKEYREWLLQKYPELGKQNQNKNSGQYNVPIAVEIVGAVNKTQHRLGIPFDMPLKLTSYKEAQGMIEDFDSWGWKQVQVKLTGWFNRSVDHSVPTKLKLIKQLGGKKDFRNLVSATEQNGYVLFPEADFLYIKDTKPFDGFSLYRDVARYVNRKRVEKYPYSFVWFGERTQWGKLSYINRPAAMNSMIDGFTKSSANLGLRNIAFRSMGSKLSGDYNEKRAVSREAAMKMRQEKLAELTKSGTGILLTTGFAYAVPWTSFITGMPLGDSAFGITDVSVPFYQIVLHGLVPYTGAAINLAEDYTKNLLKTIESGAGLYFSFMAEETAVLQETKFRQFYANEYGKWAADADVLYRQFTADFAGLYNQEIVDHRVLAPNVTLTEYEDGTRVIVNASGNAWINRDFEGSLGTMSIEADNYIVVRRGE